jgi:glyoxalase family protein
MDLHGIHHVTSVSAKIGDNAAFYTRVLGMRLVKKSVNQDDTSAYHLFYADKVGSPGTDMTFFDWPSAHPEQRGTDSIVLTAFRIHGADALAYWAQRLSDNGITHEGIQTFHGREVIAFDDPEGQRLMLVDDGGAAYTGEAWDGSDVPTKFALRGFYAVMLSIPELEQIDPIMTLVLDWTEVGLTEYMDGRQVRIYRMGKGGPGREVWVMVEPEATRAQPGAGGTHHVAFRVADVSEQEFWHQRVQSVGLPISGFIDRYYFKSIYFRISNGILFEIATDEPGFAVDEPLESLGERLALPPFLEPRREMIEARLKPIVMPEVK